jgi:hypothetical protein
MQSQIQNILKDRFPSFQLMKVPWTSHWNVVRMQDTNTGKYYIAKAIMDFADENFENENRKAMNQSWELETKILASLPAWWGLQLVDSFQEGPIRIIVTSEIPNISWLQYSSSKSLDRKIALDLERQIRWLSESGISHNDLELKNILFTGNTAIIIDFEKALQSPGRNVDKLIESFSEKENLKGIAHYLKGRLTVQRNIPRRASMRRRKRVHRKSRKTKIL